MFGFTSTLDPQMKASRGLPKVRHRFSSLGDAIKTNIVNARVLHQGLAVLLVAAKEGATEYLSPHEIADCLEVAGIACEPESIRKAFARAGNKVKRKRQGKIVRYKAMLPGYQDVEFIFASGNIEILFVDGERPRTDRKRLAEILSELQGTVKISDPYYGLRSLDALEMISKDCDVQFLSVKTNEEQSKFVRHANDLRKENPRIKIRLYPKPNELHDRYILTGSRLLVIGHGLKDIGGKESFIIRIDKAVAPDLLLSVGTAFDARWDKAAPI